MSRNILTIYRAINSQNPNKKEKTVIKQAFARQLTDALLFHLYKAFAPQNCLSQHFCMLSAILLSNKSNPTLLQNYPEFLSPLMRREKKALEKLY